MEGGTKVLSAILGGIIGVAILSVIVSRRSNTSGVISSAFGGLASILTVAVSPVTGATPLNNAGGNGLNARPAGNFLSGVSNFLGQANQATAQAGNLAQTVSGFF